MNREFQAKYEIVKINTLDKFKELKDNWNYLFSEDKNSHLYVSWDWLNILFSSSSVNWFVLAVQHTESKKHIAFLQFSLEGKKFKKVLSWQLLKLGAYPLGNYCGVLCTEEFEKPAMELIASYLCKHVSWDKLFITNSTDPRVELLLSFFTENGYELKRNARSVSTRIELPETWELYLKETLGKKTKKTFVRLLNRLAENENAKITRVDKENLKHHLDILFELWQNKWGAQPNVEIRKKILSELFGLGKLQLNLLWEYQYPIAAQCLIFDPINKTVYAHITGFDPNYPKISPGNMIGLYSIKEAIENGYKFYEFYEGDDSYKLAFGAVRRYPTTVKITNKKLKTLFIDKLRSLTEKLKKSA